MQRFETIAVHRSVADIDLALREYDLKGYELVAVTDLYDKSVRILFFKRPFVDVLEKREENYNAF